VRRRLITTAVAGVALLAAAACEGTWAPSSSPSPVRNIHAALMRNGKVLLIAGSGNDRANFAAGSFKTAIYDPVADRFDQNVTTPLDFFCAGHSFLPDGRLLVMGGTMRYGDDARGIRWGGEKRARIFNPTTKQYENAPDMAIGRWYPTGVIRGDGKIVTLAGYDENGGHSNTYQVFDSATGTWTANRGIGNDAVGIYSPLYPSMHLTADGRLFYSGVHAWADGPGTSPYLWDMNSNTVQWLANTPAIDVDRRDQGASVLLPPAQDQRVMAIGGSGTATTAVIDLKAANPQFVAGPPIDAGKQYVAAVILPDGRVLQTGGTTDRREVHGVQPVPSSQILDPRTMTWTKAANQEGNRTYHSGALLLPDGRVLTFGGDPLDGNFNHAIQLFSPSYMTKPRPSITSAPTEITWNVPFGITTSKPIASAVLIRPSATTHSSDPDQRSIDLAVSGSTLRVPANHNLTPPGWYMLFVRDADNVPSVAKWVHVS
jgi:hypothetical protein